MPDPVASDTVVDDERIITVKDIDPRHRHTVIFQLFKHLPPSRSLQLVADHDPKPLHAQLEIKHGPRCQWTYLEQGPDQWRIRLRLLPSPQEATALRHS